MTVEFSVSTFDISDGAFGSCFYFGTGFHGLCSNYAEFSGLGSDIGSTYNTMCNIHRHGVLNSICGATCMYSEKMSTVAIHAAQTAPAADGYVR
jgi:hypothetical protein